MTTANERNLFNEIREGLEAYAERGRTLPRPKNSQPHVKAICGATRPVAGRRAAGRARCAPCDAHCAMIEATTTCRGRVG